MMKSFSQLDSKLTSLHINDVMKLWGNGTNARWHSEMMTNWVASALRSFQMTSALKSQIKAIKSSRFVDRVNNVMTSTNVDPDRDGSTAKCPVCLVRHLERQWFRTSLFHWLLFIQHKVMWCRSLVLRRLVVVMVHGTTIMTDILWLLKCFGKRKNTHRIYICRLNMGQGREDHFLFILSGSIGVIQQDFSIYNK